MIREPPAPNCYQWYDDRFKVSINPNLEKERGTPNLDILSSPRRIYDFLDSKVAGNDEMKRTISCAIYSKYALNIAGGHGLFIGNSGTGKSFIFSVLSKIVPVVEMDSSQMSASSYKGTCRITNGLDLLCEKTNSYSPKGIVVYDEWDKLLEKHGKFGIEGEVLRLMDGGEVFIGPDTPSPFNPNRLCNCKDVTFFFCGTFATLGRDRPKHSLGFVTQEPDTKNKTLITKDDILESRGSLVSSEFLGRLSFIECTEPMTADKIRYVLSSEKYSPIAKLSEKYHIQLNLTDDTSERLCTLGEHYGLRGVTNEITRIINQRIFEDETISSINI